MLTAMNREEGDIASFFVEDLGLALAPKMCLDQSQTFEEVKYWWEFTVGRKKNDRPITDLRTGQILIGVCCRNKKKYPFFSWPAPSRCSKACVYQVSLKNSKSWMRRTNIKSNLTPKIDYILKPSNYDAKPWFLHLTARKSKSPRRFLRIRPWNFAYVCNCLLYTSPSPRD